MAYAVMASGKKKAPRANTKPGKDQPYLFIGWSGTGTRSEKMAILLKKWMKQIIQASNPWYSADDIGSGAPWSNELISALHNSYFGIICVTPDNYQNPWLNYEVGMLVHSLDSNVCPLVLGMGLADFEASPLSRQQARLASDKEQVLQLVLSVNSALGHRGIDESVAKTSFERYWEDLDFAKLPAPAQKPKKQDLEKKVDEILSSMQAINNFIFRAPVPVSAGPFGLTWGQAPENLKWSEANPDLGRGSKDPSYPLQVRVLAQAIGAMSDEDQNELMHLWLASVRRKPK